MRKFHVKKGDEVVVIAGSELGRRGKILAVHTKKERVTVAGLKLIKRHLKKSQQHPQGTISEREGTIHISNVMAAAKYDAGRTAKAPETTA